MAFMTPALSKFTDQIDEWFANDRRPANPNKLMAFFAALQADLNRMQDVDVRTLTGAIDLVDTDAYYQFIDCGGAGRNVDLPVVDSGVRIAFFIVNTSDAAETIAVRTAAGAAVVSVPGSADATTNSAALVVWDGTAWRVSPIISVDAS